MRVAFRYAKLHGKWTIVEIDTDTEFSKPENEWNFVALGSDESFDPSNFPGFEWGSYVRTPLSDDEAKNEKDHRYNADCPPVRCVREVGFDSEFRINGEESKMTEKMFFIDSLGNNSFQASREAVEEGIRYLQNQVDVLKDYLLNGENNVTTDWTKSVKNAPPDGLCC